MISTESARRLRDAKDIRNQFAHAYPPASWRALAQVVEMLLAELDSYRVKVDEWLRDSGILPSN